MGFLWTNNQPTFLLNKLKRGEGFYHNKKYLSESEGIRINITHTQRRVDTTSHKIHCATWSLIEPSQKNTQVMLTGVVRKAVGIYGYSPRIDNLLHLNRITSQRGTQPVLFTKYSRNFIEVVN